ncbi:MAG: hypothetical protein LBR83_03330 [Clostridiales bacterium]|jgi:hypothetical protein|nr:hypothetical protein [Clostridiales bacterium]
MEDKKVDLALLIHREILKADPGTHPGEVYEILGEIREYLHELAIN